MQLCYSRSSAGAAQSAPRDSWASRSQRVSAAKHYYLSDGLGSVTALTDSSGNVAQTYKTDPFGVSTGGTGSVTNPWQFAGEYKDPAGNANLYKIGARNYDPTLGRWTQQDPLDQADDLQNANRYLYAAGDPVNMVDSAGTFTKKRNLFSTRWFFNEKETADAMYGSAGFAFLVPVPVARLALGISSVTLGAALNHGKCLGIIDPAAGPTVPFLHSCD